MAGKRHLLIADPTRPTFTQSPLFSTSTPTSRYNPYPRLISSTDDAREVIRRGCEEGMLGTDYEFNDSRPTIAGFACGDTAGAVRWNDELVKESVDRATRTGATLVGHSVAGAEREQLAKRGIHTPVTLWQDSMIAFHLCNSDFTKMSGKEESDDAGALGLMNLWVTASMYTDLPKWKDCRGKYCEGPCPSHRVFDYCAVDSWASLAAMRGLLADMQAKQIPYQFYRECMELSAVCVEMQKRGLRVDRETVRKLETDNEYAKGKLFPFELIGGKPRYAEFNPKSGKEVIQYCKDNGISLPTKRNKSGEPVPSTEKKDIAETLEKMARREGFFADTISDLIDVIDQAPQDEVSRPLDTVLRLYKYKKTGKGSKATFNPKYFNGDDFLHPRFIQTGTSTGRLASARPNGQNIDPLSKTAIIPDNEDEDLIDSDLSQLELRMCLYLSGVDPAILGKDVFIWLAENSDGLFSKAAAMLGCDERQVGKRLAHAGNYLEGFQLVYPKDLSSPRIKTEIEYGARVLYKDWEYCGGIVSFTGANLSHSLFGDKTLANRKKALDLQENVYFGRLGRLRDWHRKVLAQAEQGYVRSVTGRYLALYGKPEDNAKATGAFHGQGTSADHVQAIMLRFKREMAVVANLQVHDSLVFSIPKSWSNEKAKEFIAPMYQETWRLPGFSAPGKLKRGPNYGSLVQI